MRLACRIAYLGDGFYGSQMQPGQRTVEGEFLAACERLDLFEDWRKAGFSSAGRTDRGVHARGQIFAISTSHPERAIEVLNLQLPRDCWCRGYVEVEEGFNPRYRARSRTYRYFFLDTDLDVQAMAHAGGLLVGTHDFSAFARVEPGKDPRRTICRVVIGRDGPFVVMEVKGESFLWNMVRGMATAIRSLGRGELDEEGLARLLEGRLSGQRIASAPAGGLVLWDVDCGITFLPLSPGSRHLGFLRERYRYHRLREGLISRFMTGEEDRSP